jgi:hypothetical protein
MFRSFFDHPQGLHRRIKSTSQKCVVVLTVSILKHRKVVHLFVQGRLDKSLKIVKVPLPNGMLYPVGQSGR